MIMKKMLAIALLTMMTISTSVQGIWSTIETPADELQGEKGRKHYKYSVEGVGEIEIYDWITPYSQQK